MRQKQGNHNEHKIKKQLSPCLEVKADKKDEGSANSEEESQKHKKIIDGAKQWINKCSRADGIAILALIVNIALAIATYRLYFIAVNESKSAQDAANTSKDALTISQKDFEISNAPYLQVERIGGITFKIGDPISVSIMIKNLGTYPAKVTKMSFTTLITRDIPVFSQQPNDIYGIGNVYITKDNPLAEPVNDLIKQPLDTIFYNRIIKKGYKMYLQGDIFYKNLVTNKDRRYKFIMGIDIIGKMQNYPLNENEDVK